MVHEQTIRKDDGRYNRKAAGRSRRHLAGRRGACRQLRAVRAGPAICSSPPASCRSRTASSQASGLLGRDLDTAAGKEAAKFCAINILAQAKAALGDLEKIRRLVKITVFVASTPDFTEQHLVANGASDFLVAVLGERGKHARSAVGMASLPLNAAVEIEAIIEIA